MSGDSVQRRLAAVLSADAVGYSGLMAHDEMAALEQIKLCRALIAGLVRQHGGRVVDAVGDNLLAEFPSAVDAVECAIEIQRQLEARYHAGHSGAADDERLRFRIGVNLGDLIIDGERIAGDGVNIAARIEALAEPGAIAISRAILDQVSGKIPMEVEDGGERTLKNMPNPVHVFYLRVSPATCDASGCDDEGVRSVLHGVPGFAGRHAIAVLPFQNLSRDAEQEYFGEGLAEDLITRFQALRLYPVIARSSSFTYAGKAIDLRTVGRELGAHYIVAGSVRRSGERLRVSAELVDAEDTRQIWSAQYDREMCDIFDLQDEITAAIVASIGPALTRSEIDHAWKRAPRNLDAWDCIHRALWHLFRYNKEDTAQACACALKALKLDEHSSTAYTLLAFCHMFEFLYQWSERPLDSLDEAMRAAEKAVALDRDDPNALTALGRACSLSGDHERAVEVLERAAEINPSSALACWALGAALAPAGRPEDAIPMLEKAVRLSPQDPLMHEFLFNIGTAHFVAGRYKQAVEFARRSLTLEPDQSGVYRLLAASQAYLGRLKEARAALQELLKRVPNFSREHLAAFLPHAIVELYARGLRKAGWKG